MSLTILFWKERKSSNHSDYCPHVGILGLRELERNNYYVNYFMLIITALNTVLKGLQKVTFLGERALWVRILRRTDVILLTSQQSQCFIWRMVDSREEQEVILPVTNRFRLDYRGLKCLILFWIFPYICIISFRGLIFPTMP